jgi:hypothetical protein
VSVLERLTYLIGICAAIVGWSVNQLSANLSAAKVLVYEVSESSAKPGFSTSRLLLQNVSRTQQLGAVEVHFDGSRNDCPLELDMRGVGVSPPGDQGPDFSQTKSSVKIPFDTLAPGSAYEFSATHPAGCRVACYVKAEPSTRLLSAGLESFLIRSQFQILVALTVVFALVFAVTYGMSVTVARRQA